MSKKQKTDTVLTLRTPIDVRNVRKNLYENQKGIDAVTGLAIPEDKAVLDHDHKTHKVRAVLHRQTNAALGKIENLFDRYLSYWYTGTLAEFLRQCANYIEHTEQKPFYHPGWIKWSKAQFNKLNTKQKDFVLVTLGESKGHNNDQRKSNFTKAIRAKDFDEIRNALSKGKLCT